MTAENLLLTNEELKRLFVYRNSNQYGGKAGRGRNKTTSFQLFSEKLFAGSYFSYTKGDTESFSKAVTKAIIWIEKILIKNNRCPNCACTNCESDHK